LIPIFEPVFAEAERAGVLETIDSGWISSQGRFIPQFEDEFARWNSQKFGVATSNCTTALHLTLVALGIGQGDEVICPALTFIAPANMIRLAEAKPVFVDITEPSWTMDSDQIRTAITEKTKAIMVVHAFGHAADMDPIMRIAEEHGLHVIEDTAEAPGARYRGKMVGTFGIASCYSFFANKIMTTGEGGLVITSDADLDRRLRTFRDHGMSREKRYHHVVAGFNYRMTNMQAAVGVGQLSRLDEILAMRSKQEAVYKALFADEARVTWRPVADWCEHVHWMSTISLRKEELRDPLLEYLGQQGIDCRQMVFPVPMAVPYEDENDRDRFPIAYKISLSSLHLPSSLNLTEENQQHIAKLIIEWLQKHDK